MTFPWWRWGFPLPLQAEGAPEKAKEHAGGWFDKAKGIFGGAGDKAHETAEQAKETVGRWLGHCQ